MEPSKSSQYAGTGLQGSLLLTEAFVVESRVQTRRGKGFGVPGGGGDDHSKEDPGIFEVVVGDRGEEAPILRRDGCWTHIGVSFPELGRS
jgi:hypothetical protein